MFNNNSNAVTYIRKEKFTKYTTNRSQETEATEAAGKKANAYA